MNAAGKWEALTVALDRWRSAGRRPVFWLRDDDATAPGAALDRLLGLTGRFEVPVALAVIPAHAGTALARRVAGERLVTVVVHGWSHENHAFAGQKKQELGLHRPSGTVIDELSQALGRIEELFPGRSAPVLVPPWNRIDSALIQDLAPIGYRALSVFGMPKPAPPQGSESGLAGSPFDPLSGRFAATSPPILGGEETPAATLDALPRPVGGRGGLQSKPERGPSGVVNPSANPALLPVINTTVDIIDWHGTRGGRGHALIIGEIISQLDAALADPSRQPIGILTHHLVHDESAWAFLEALFEHTARNGICRWETIDGLLAEFS